MSYESAVFWNCVEATAQWRAGLEEFRPAFRDMDVEALSAVEATIAAVAERFRRDPDKLDRLEPGLSAETPEQILASCDRLEERFRRERPSGVGFGGERLLVEIKAVRRVARDAMRVREGAHV